MARFLAKKLGKVGEIQALDDEQSHHIVHVLRAKLGDAIELIDGAGGLARAQIVDIGKTECRVTILALEAVAATSRVTLVFGYPKGPAFDFIVRKSVEIGVAAFRPLLTDHSLHVKDWNASRWNRVIAEVCKQCQETTLPPIHPPQRLKDWLEERDSDRALVFCDEADREARNQLSPSVSGVDLLVGAEGGWSDDERERLRAHRPIALGLGRNRLRAETAAIVGLTVVKTHIGEI